MGVDVYRFKVKKKIPAKVIKEAARNSRNIKKEMSEFFGTTDPKEIEDMIKDEIKEWRKKRDGYTYTDDTVMTLLSLYPYLKYRGYITFPEEVI